MIGEKALLLGTGQSSETTIEFTLINLAQGWEPVRGFSCINPSDQAGSAVPTNELVIQGEYVGRITYLTQSYGTRQDPNTFFLWLDRGPVKLKLDLFTDEYRDSIIVDVPSGGEFKKKMIFIPNALPDTIRITFSLAD